MHGCNMENFPAGSTWGVVFQDIDCVTKFEIFEVAQNTETTF